MCQKEILGKMGIFSGGYKSIDEWCYTYDEVDLELIWGAINYLRWEAKWLTNSMVCEDLSKFRLWCFEVFEE